jgi:hypothetical protein
MQDAYGLSKRLPTVPVSLLAAHQIDALSIKRGAAEITASELAGVPDAQDSSLETLRCAVADLLYAVSRIFREKPQDAREYLLLHAAALLRLGPCDRPVVLSNRIAHKRIRRRLSALPFNQHCAQHCARFSNIPD